MAISTTPPGALLNGEPITLKDVNGKPVEATIRQLTIRQLYQFTQHLRAEQMPELVALSLGTTIESVDALDLDSYGEALSKAMALNFPKVVKLMGRDPVLAADVLPVLNRLQTVAEEAMKFSAGQLPVPSPSASAEETGSESSISPLTDSGTS